MTKDNYEQASSTLDNDHNAFLLFYISDLQMNGEKATARHRTKANCETRKEAILLIREALQKVSEMKEFFDLSDADINDTYIKPILP